MNEFERVFEGVMMELLVSWKIETLSASVLGNVLQHFM